METGILVAAVLDKKSPSLKADVAMFQKRLTQLQKKYGLAGFVAAKKQVGTKLTVKVIAVGKMTKTAGEWGSKPRSARAVATEIKKDLAKRK